MRWLIALLLALAGAGLAAGGLLVVSDDGATELLPDLDQAVPSALSVVRVGDSDRVTFRSAVDNVGRGPLVIEGSRTSRGEPSMSVRQAVRSSDGSTRTIDLPARMRYVRSATHAHWHLLGFERYELRSASDGRLVGRDRKTGFCLGDRYDTRPAARIENEPPAAVWTEECGRDEPELLSVAEGISPGYGDDYAPRLEGQYLDVTSVPAGRYLVVHRANPDRTIRESDYGNNAASVLIALRRTTGETPTVRVLARCPHADRCERE
jgi:hypothetical protein